MLDRVKQSYAEAAAIIAKPTPYRYAGGHNVEFAPSLSYAEGIGAKGAGLDCSSFASIVLRAGGILSIPRATLPLDTTDFLKWGLAGEGDYLTLWVRSDAIQDHVFLDFHGDPLFTHRYCEAPHPGLDCRWLSSESFTGFSPRRWPRA
jgi:cell wall-associated NlpC family hydrolase